MNDSIQNKIESLINEEKYKDAVLLCDEMIVASEGEQLLFAINAKFLSLVAGGNLLSAVELWGENDSKFHDESERSGDWRYNTTYLFDILGAVKLKDFYEGSICEFAEMQDLTLEIIDFVRRSINAIKEKSIEQVYLNLVAIKAGLFFIEICRMAENKFEQRENYFICVHDTLDRILGVLLEDFARAEMKLEFELLPMIRAFNAGIIIEKCWSKSANAWIEEVWTKYEKEISEALKNEYIDDYEKTGKYKYDVSILVIGYNKLDYTKICVENLLKYMPAGLNYELILLNHGSSDGTKEYFESIHPTKQIDVSINNSGVLYLHHVIQGKYWITVSNDVIVTENAIKNMITCMEESPDVVWAVPTTPNVSNLQTIKSPEKLSIQEMLTFAAKNNVSDKRRWEQRVKLMDPIAIGRAFEYIKCCYNLNKRFYLGLFPDDQRSIELRRAGDKMMLIKDAFCYHYGSVTLKDELKSKSDEDGNKGENAFYIKERHRFKAEYGIDPWGIGSCWSPDLFKLLECTEKHTCNILGVNCGLGSNPLKIKESLKENVGNFDAKVYNVTDDQSYILDLPSVSDEFLFLNDCTQTEMIFPTAKFRYIVIESGLQGYDDVSVFLLELVHKLEKKGVFAIKTSYYEELVQVQDVKLEKTIISTFPDAIKNKDWCVIFRD